MAVMHVYSVETATGTEMPGSRLRTGSAQAAIDHALQANARFPAPGHVTRIHYSGDFVDPAFTELTQLAQQNGLEFEIGGA